MLKLEEAHTRLKTSRMASGYKTATEFCKKTGIPLSTYNMHETGKRKMQPEIAEKYAKLLEVNSAWLITGVGAPYEHAVDHEEPLTTVQYLNLLNYNHASTLKPSPTTESSPPINAILFCKIFTEMVHAMNEFDVSLNIKYISDYTAEIYNDIVQTSTLHQEQLTMVNLAVTLFKKNLPLLKHS